MNEQLDIHTMVAELTRTHRHREPFKITRGTTTIQLRHTTEAPALIYQLLGATPARSLSESGSAAVSKPAARIEALDTVILIDDEAGHWLDQLGGTIAADRIDPHTTLTVRGSGTVLTLARLHGQYPALERCHRLTGLRDENGQWCCQRHHLEHDIERWWRQARIMTGWDSPSYRPYNTCPVCDERGGLRINLAVQSALCIECRSTWSPNEIGLLADHIRTENDTPIAGTA